MFVAGCDGKLEQGMNNQIAGDFPLHEASEKPFVTFALFAYNQEEYIREAIEGALAQTYSPLEIILSDDCSTDRTFAIMQEIARGYAGPHQIVFNKNKDNLGIGGHINKLMSIAKGELIVIAAGDDVSLPARVSSLVDAWASGGRRADLLCSDYCAIDEHGNKLGNRKGCVIANMNPLRMAAGSYGVIGATAAWSRKLWSTFGDLHAGAIYEDQILPFRAALTGGINYVQMPLVNYRQNVSTWVARGRTMDSDEMQRRTERLIRNSVITASIQLQDAIFANRFDLISPIVRRLNENHIVHSVYTRNTNLVGALLQTLRAGSRIKPVVRAIAQVYVPYLHKLILKRRAADSEQRSNTR